MSMVAKMLVAIGIKLLKESVLEDILIWALESLAESTKTKVDDKIVDIVKKGLGRDAN